MTACTFVIDCPVSQFFHTACVQSGISKHFYLHKQVVLVFNKLGFSAANMYKGVYNPRERRFWTEFIHVYKSLPALWKIKDVGYYNKGIKNREYGILVNTLKSKYVNADKREAVRIINKMRAIYRCEKKRMIHSQYNGTQYIPTLWYFDLLAFLDHQDQEVDEEGNIDESSLDEQDIYRNAGDDIEAMEYTPDKLDSFWAEFIDLYKSLPSLWKKGHKHYHDRIKKSEDYEILVEKLKEQFPNATRNTAKLKINSMRTTYRRELRKVIDSQQPGADPEDAYVPNLWYFDLLAFLHEQEECSQESNVDETNSKDYNEILEDLKIINEKINNKKRKKEFEPVEYQPINNNAYETFWTEFIEIYKSSPSLWKMSCKEYYNKQIKDEAYKKLEKKLLEKFPNATISMAKKKINNLRITYRRELKKVLESQQLGADPINEYVPTLWYYNLFAFLHNGEYFKEEQNTTSDCELDVEELLCSDDHEFYDSPPKKRKDHNGALQDQEDCTEGRNYTEEINTIRNKEGDTATTQKNSFEFIGFKYEDVSMEIPEAAHLKNQDDKLAQCWAAQCKDMDRNQKLLARKLIADVLFHGCMGNLNINHIRQVNDVLK